MLGGISTAAMATKIARPLRSGKARTILNYTLLFASVLYSDRGRVGHTGFVRVENFFFERSNES